MGAICHGKVYILVILIHPSQTFLNNMFRTLPDNENIIYVPLPQKDVAGVHRIGLLWQKILLPHPQVYVGVGWSTTGPHRYATRLEIVGACEWKHVVKQNKLEHLNSLNLQSCSLCCKVCPTAANPLSCGILLYKDSTSIVTSKAVYGISIFSKIYRRFLCPLCKIGDMGSQVCVNNLTKPLQYASFAGDNGSPWGICHVLVHLREGKKSWNVGVSGTYKLP